MSGQHWYCDLCQLSSVIGDGWLRMYVELQHGIPIENKKCPVEICPSCLERIKPHVNREVSPSDES